MAKLKGDVSNPAAAVGGLKRIEWAERDMPVLRLVRERFGKEKPLKGMRMSACLHITAETANLARALQAGGADLVLCASNPLSTQDDVAASLCKDFDIPTYAIKGESKQQFYNHLHAAIQQMLTEIREHPYTPPQRPAYPDRHGMGIPETDR